MRYRFMRVIMFFDLPSTSKAEVREYSLFVKFIKKHGFSMMQESVYTKLALNQAVVDKTMAELRKNVPKEGIISILVLTEIQFNSIENILGEIKSDVISSDKKVVIL